MSIIEQDGFGETRHRRAGRRTRLRWVVAALAAVVVVAAGIVIAVRVTGGDDDPRQAAARAYLDAYARGDAAAAARATSGGSTARAALTRSLAAMAPAKPAFTLGDVTTSTGDTGRVDYAADWRLPGGSWRYRSSLDVRRAGDSWQVVYAPSAIAPGLRSGEDLELASVRADRAPLQDRAGRPLFTRQQVVTVGIDPSAVTNLDTLARDLAKVPALDSTAREITTAVRAAGKSSRFVPVITLRRPAYDAIRARVHDLPGTAFQTRDAVLSPKSGFASALLGTVGPATAEQVTASKGTIGAGDDVGRGGLQEHYERTLAGTSGHRVLAVDADTGEARRLATPVAPKAGEAVRLTLDRGVQTAADAALDDVPLPAAVVVTQRSTGQVLAVANSAAAPGNIAMTGQYPPGSVFKIVSFASLFADTGVTPATKVTCPAKYVVNGQTISNENAFDKGRVDLERAFAFSCNTTTAALVLRTLKSGQLARTAAGLGLGQKWQLPVDAFSGSIPAAAQSNELAAEAYGQGRTLVSPLLMAEIVGGASTGAPIAPTLVAGERGARLPAQPAAVTRAMNTVLRAVVTVPGATGRSLAGLPGSVAGKTGTAEYGTDMPPKAHSWFAGVRGDLAFAVFVDTGEFTPHTGVAVAKKLLEKIPA